jgi:hypothetical protein
LLFVDVVVRRRRRRRRRFVAIVLWIFYYSLYNVFLKSYCVLTLMMILLRNNASIRDKANELS